MLIFADKIYENPIETLIAFDNKSFEEAFSRIEILRENHYLVGYVRYEAKDVFLGKQIDSDLPLLYFEVFDEENVKREDEAQALCCGERETTDEVIQNIFPMIDFKEYSVSIEEIKQEIALGNTYEVNYTYDWQVNSSLDGLDLFKTLLPRQKTPYNAYIKNDYEEILSFSPELFFELENNVIRTKPMKGTVRRGATDEEDKKNIEFLRNDEKNRAENVMIVDLLRNDLGRIAKTGTVKVDKLFEIETHKTLHQMTSEISAKLLDNLTLFEIFEAIFPCGSITGAPKINTMEIIERIEKGARGVYCGAIGLISPQKTVFSVPIRILRKANTEKNYLYRVGGAIVWDSTAKDEWDETLTKMKFLQNRHSEGAIRRISNMFHLLPQHNSIAVAEKVQLVETMLIKNGEIQDLDLHLVRMKKSAEALGFIFEKKKCLKKVGWAFQPNIKLIGDKILRLLLNKQGAFETQILPLDEIKTSRVIISKKTVNSNEPMLYYKTTHRPWYAESMGKIKSGEIFDEIFFNERGELTEGARTNVILQVGGELFTPPVECGLLNGIMRQKMLIDDVEPILSSRIDFGICPAGNAGEMLNQVQHDVIEKVLYLDDLKKAEKVFCINSVRGVKEVLIDYNNTSPLRGEGDFQYEPEANIRKSGEGAKKGGTLDSNR